jgi:hypothetical protein
MSWRTPAGVTTFPEHSFTAWFAERRLLAERERACDEAVIQCGVAPRIYLAGLAKVCRFHLFPDVAGISRERIRSENPVRPIQSCRPSEPFRTLFVSCWPVLQFS